MTDSWQLRLIIKSSVGYKDKLVAPKFKNQKGTEFNED